MTSLIMRYIPPAKPSSDPETTPTGDHPNRRSSQRPATTPKPTPAAISNPMPAKRPQLVSGSCLGMRRSLASFEDRAKLHEPGSSPARRPPPRGGDRIRGAGGEGKKRDFWREGF